MKKIKILATLTALAIGLAINLTTPAYLAQALAPEITTVTSLRAEADGYSQEMKVPYTGKSMNVGKGSASPMPWWIIMMELLGGILMLWWFIPVRNMKKRKKSKKHEKTAKNS